MILHAFGFPLWQMTVILGAICLFLYFYIHYGSTELQTDEIYEIIRVWGNILFYVAVLTFVFSWIVVMVFAIGVFILYYW